MDQTTAPSKPSRRAFLTLPGGIMLFQRRFVITGCESHGEAADAYMTRYRIIEREDAPGRPGFGLYLHIFHRSDRDVMHNHPWSFTSFVLLNGYVEEVPFVYPNYRNEPDAAARFHAATARARQMPGDVRYGDFHGELRRHFTHDYPPGAICTKTYPNGEVTIIGQKPKHWLSPTFHIVEWIDLTNKARRLDVRPLTRNVRPEWWVHRVKLRRRRDGSEIPAVTLIWRGPKLRMWGFWDGFRFTSAKTYFKTNGC